MSNLLDRRAFIRTAVGVGAAISVGAVSQSASSAAEKGTTLFKISLAEWSFHRALQAGKMDNLEFPKVAKQDFGIDCVEYVNTFFMDKAKDQKYLVELKQRCDDLGVASGLIMCDHEGDLGDPSNAKRFAAVGNHFKWLEAAKFLGCHSIRVNARSAGSLDEQHKLVVDGLNALCDVAAKFELNILVENHGGLSSNGRWLAEVINTVINAGHKNCGTLPDFGNFTVAPGETYDRYQGVAEMMPFAKGVSAKSRVFDAAGNEAEIDFERMMKIVIGAGYHGYVGIEFSGDQVTEHEGVRLTKNLLTRLLDKLGNHDPTTSQK
jgi:sugar phosphate isomerase/epimerase